MNGVPFNRLYRAVGVSKQAVLKRERNEGDLKLNIALTAHMVEKIRADHPAMGLRELYFKIAPDPGQAGTALRKCFLISNMV